MTLYDRYLNALDNRGFTYILTGLSMLAFLVAFWYWIYTLIF